MSQVPDFSKKNKNFLLSKHPFIRRSIFSSLLPRFIDFVMHLTIKVPSALRGEIDEELGFRIQQYDVIMTSNHFVPIKSYLNVGNDECISYSV